MIGLGVPQLDAAVALDSDVTTFLMQANTAGYDPACDADAKVAPEREAAFLVFLHIERIIALPTVKRQVARISDADFLELHRGFDLVHLEEPLVDEAAVAARANSGSTTKETRARRRTAESSRRPNLRARTRC